MADSNQQPIIIKRKKIVHGGAHGGAWKVAFADFMTAMMAFFLVMWLVGQAPEVREAVAGHFRDPGRHKQEGKSGVLKGSSAIIQSKKEGASSGKPSPVEGGGPTEKEKAELTLAAKNIVRQLEKVEAFERLKKNIKIQMTSEGLRIILNESVDAPAFFEPGSSKLLQKSAVILVTIARELGNLENRLVIEGHTDAAFSGTGAYSNWELSADRANSARQLMEVSGLYDRQVREVRGFADQFPMIMDNPLDARNRRVTVTVLYMSREGAFDQIEVGSDILSQIGG